MLVTCSTTHCYNKTEQDYIPKENRWWELIANPAPFCDDCKKGKTPDKNKGKYVEISQRNNDRNYIGYYNVVGYWLPNIMALFRS